MINLDNKVALIPGGATMIGKKVAHEFIRAGAKVTVCDIDETGGRELQREWQYSNGRRYITLRESGPSRWEPLQREFATGLSFFANNS